jgi:predicted MPP superfamily phosphohydrolase
MGFIIFIAIAQIIVILAHVLLYFSWIHFFHISDPGLIRALGIILAILSVSFIGASLLVFWRDNLVIKIFYYLAAIWLGLLLYFFLSTVLIWIIAGIIWISGAHINVGIVAATLIIAATLFSIYGLWNAANPVVRHIQVDIKNLPPSWHGRTAVQISDIHLGTIWGRPFMDRIVDKIAELKPDIVFITGDLFDGEGDDLAREVEPLKRLSPPLGTYFITGNHETYLGIEKTEKALIGIPLTFLHDQMVDIDGIQLLGISYPIAGQHKNLEEILRLINPAQPNIVLYHSPVHIDLFRQFGVNLQLAGHTHRGQIWPLNYITNKVYGGYDRGLHVEGDYILYTSVGAGTWGPPMRTGNRPEIVAIDFK